MSIPAIKKQFLDSLIHNIARLSDEKYQERVWVRAEGPECDDIDDAERCGHATSHIGSTQDFARAESGDSAALPDVLAGLFCIAWLAPIQSDSDRFLCRHRAAAGKGLAGASLFVR